MTTQQELETQIAALDISINTAIKERHELRQAWARAVCDGRIKVGDVIVRERGKKIHARVTAILGVERFNQLRVFLSLEWLKKDGTTSDVQDVDWYDPEHLPVPVQHAA